MASRAKRPPMTGAPLMSEMQNLPPLNDSEPTGQSGAGALLKQAREASGLHIAALAVLLKVPVKKLEALESDRLDLLPDVVFVRALASSVCRTLKIEPSQILSRLPQTHVPKLTYQGSVINEPFRTPSDGPGPSMWARVSRPAVVGGMFLMLGALILIFLPFIKMSVGEIRQEVRAPKVQNSDVSRVTAATGVAAEPPAVLESPRVLVPVSGLVSDATTTLVATQTPVPAGSQLANDLVVFTAKTESWVEATDAKGLVVLRRNLAAGEVVSASGALPLKIVVGRANATQVEIRGKLFDATSIAKDNVARFEVN